MGGERCSLEAVQRHLVVAGSDGGEPRRPKRAAGFAMHCSLASRSRILVCWVTYPPVLTPRPAGALRHTSRARGSDSQGHCRNSLRARGHDSPGVS